MNWFKLNLNCSGMIRKKSDYSTRRKYLLPKTLLGKWSIGLAIVFVIFLFISIGIEIWVYNYYFMFSSGMLIPNRFWAIILFAEIGILSISGIGAIVLGILNIIKNKETSIFVYSSVVLSLIGVLLLGVVTWGDSGSITEEKIVTLLLSELSSNPMEDRYYIVKPEMTIRADLSKNHACREFRLRGVNLDSMVERLFVKNTEVTLMSIPSSIENGYLIDYDGKIRPYFETGGGGWALLQKENPQVGPTIEMSVPVFDAKTGIVMVYIGWYATGSGLGGEGYIIAYKYFFNRLIGISFAVLWVS